jgi:hypothetical protein
MDNYSGQKPIAEFYQFHQGTVIRKNDHTTKKILELYTQDIPP